MRYRFSLRQLLAAVAVTAIAVVALQQWYGLEKARNDFEMAQEMNDVGRIKFSDLLSKERNLHVVETHTIWISERRALNTHVDRLEEIVHARENRLALRLFAGTDEAHQADIKQLVLLKQELMSLRAASTR